MHEADLVGDRRRDRGGAAAYYDELQQRLAKRDGRIVLAVAGGRAVAAMGFCIDEDAAYVTPDVRRHGTITDLVVGGLARPRHRPAPPRRSRAADPRGRLPRLAIGALAANAGAEQRLYRDFGLPALRVGSGEGGLRRARYRLSPLAGRGLPKAASLRSRRG